MMKSIVQKHSVLMFLIINFAWTWFFWLGAMFFKGQTLLVMIIVLLGGFGPAIGGILTLRFRSGVGLGFSRKGLVIFLVSSVAIFGIMVLRYLVGNIPNLNTLSENLTLSVLIIMLAIIVSLVGGWVISSAASPNNEVRSRMSSLFPLKKLSGWSVFGFLVYPLMILASWGLASVFAAEIEYPGLWGNSIQKVLPLYLLIFSITALIQGGNEEPGWRGLMQPELQKKINPLLAAIIVSVFWSLWHLPLYLNGFYPGDLVSGMIGGTVFRLFLSIFLAWFYNKSGGNIFLMVFMHTCFNVMVNFLPTSDLVLIVLLIIFDVVIVIIDKMFRKNQVFNNSIRGENNEIL